MPAYKSCCKRQVLFLKLKNLIFSIKTGIENTILIIFFGIPTAHAVGYVFDSIKTEVIPIKNLFEYWRFPVHDRILPVPPVFSFEILQ